MRLNDKKEWMTATDVARLTGRSDRSIRTGAIPYGWLRAKPSAGRSKRRYLIHRVWVAEWVTAFEKTCFKKNEKGEIVFGPHYKENQRKLGDWWLPTWEPREKTLGIDEAAAFLSLAPAMFRRQVRNRCGRFRRVDLVQYIAKWGGYTVHDLVARDFVADGDVVVGRLEGDERVYFDHICFNDKSLDIRVSWDSRRVEYPRIVSSTSSFQG